MNHGLSLSNSEPQSNKSKPNAKQSNSLLPTAIGIGSALFYILFTLLPNSNSMMVKWPWVFIWQFGLILGPVALLFQLWQQSFRKLGHRLDFIAGAWCIALILSASFAPFPHQAFWYGWAAICNIAFLYVLNAWLTTAARVRRLLTFQGILSIVFSAQSLISWYFQTVRPYQKTLAELRTYGIERSFDLQILTLRNWHPIGHQNYVAGYLLLAIPLLVGLAVSARGWQRFAWLGGVVLSLATLYSTASRGSWFGLMASLIVFVGFSAWQYPQLRKLLLGSGLVGLGAMVFWMVSSDRLRNLFSSLLNADPTSDIAYRLVTNTTGWNIGLDHPLFGAGLGSVTLLYQKYRPDWAGQTAELTYQLHSTPAQLWAELGGAGAFLTLASLLALSYLLLRWAISFQAKPHPSATHPSVTQWKEGRIEAPLIIGIGSALAGYSIYAITDYQLDNICISGILIIFTAILLFENREIWTDRGGSDDAFSNLNKSVPKRFTLVGSGLLVAIALWLYPIHRAWLLSNQGFLSLQQKDIASFVAYLEQAHNLAPWEPYYPYQLGWNLGELAFQSGDTQQQEALRKNSVKWFEKANLLSPNREFGYSNLGWLLVNSEPQKAEENFFQATQLTPMKRGVFFSLGFSRLKQNKIEAALQSMVTELVHEPVFVTSPIWKTLELSQLYTQVLESFEEKIIQLLDYENTEASKAQLFQILGSLKWWQGDFSSADSFFQKSPNSLNILMLSLAKTNPGQTINDQARVSNLIDKVMLAWQKPSDNEDFLLEIVSNKVTEGHSLPMGYISSLVEELQQSIEQSSDFHDWLTQKSPSKSNTNTRLGFGVISRHIDGEIPSDFTPLSSNFLMSEVFKQLFPSNSFQTESSSQ